eukprot:gene206-301_t
MSTILSVGSGASLPHLNLLKEDNLKDGKTRELLAGRQGDRTSVLVDGAAATDNDPTEGALNRQLPSQDDLLTKINTLITNELSSGKLSNDRANALRKVFSSAFNGSADGQASADTTEAAAGAGVSSAKAGAASTSVTSADPSAAVGTPAAGETSQDVGSVLNDFLKLLQDAKSTASPYGASGSSNIKPA